MNLYFNYMWFFGGVVAGIILTLSVLSLTHDVLKKESSE